VVTVAVRGMSVTNAISRVLSANNNWESILEIAKNPDIKIIISNTTEAGIVATADSIAAMPPASFPAKLLAFLYRRYQYFARDNTKGCVVLPTELIADNAHTLKKIVIELAAKNLLEADFMTWLNEANDFCNTLVDRIVPGRPGQDEQQKIAHELGYEDNLMVVVEPYNLWAIETDSDRVRETLSFTKANPEIKLVPSIYKYKEIKLRLLNGTHTLCCAIALWSGFNTVKEAMDNPIFKTFVVNLMQKEIGPAILDQDIKPVDIASFSREVIDRFSNPFL
jgi:tagaturonate reductase